MQLNPCKECNRKNECDGFGTCLNDLEQEAHDLEACPPCSECGARCAEDAKTMCKAGGDRDSCHGVRLFPDDLDISAVPFNKVDEAIVKIVAGSNEDHEKVVRHALVNLRALLLLEAVKFKPIAK
jgi:hypothetical protein